MPIPAGSAISPALRKEMVMTETSELDCMIAVDMKPKAWLFHTLSVQELSSRSRTPPVKALKPCSNAIMPNRKIATPAAISLNSGLTQNPQASTASMTGSAIRCSMKPPHL